MKQRFLSANVVLLSVISLCNDVATDMIYPLLPLFITTVGGSAAVLGVIEGVAETTASFLKLTGGILSDRVRRRKPLAFAGYFLSNALRPLYYVATTWTPVLVVRFADRIGKGLRTAPRDALIADSTPPEARARAFSFHRALDNLGALGGPLLAMAVLAVFPDNIRMVFLFSIIPGAIAVALFIFVKETHPDGHDTAQRRKNGLRELLTFNGLPRQLKLFVAAVFLFTLGNSSDAFLILKLRDAGVPTMHIPLVWGLFNLVKSLGNYPAGVVADRIGKKSVISAGWLVYGLMYILFGTVSSREAVLAVFLCYGLYHSLTEGVERAFIADMTSGELRGRAYGLYSFATGLTALPASVLFGYLWERFSPAVAFYTGASFSIAALVLFLATQRGGEPTS